MGQTVAGSVGQEHKMVRLTLDIADLSAEASYYMVFPVVGFLRRVFSIIDGVVSTADVTIGCYHNATLLGTITIATASSAAGDVDSMIPESANRGVPGDALKFTVSGGGAGGSPRGHLVVEIERD